ncbi:toprim domain-containing protein [Patescibacteria group bacterium]|nr:toprim domain-containing protein [Patescibacteria group bacterium]
MDSINKLTEIFKEFPGVGPRQAKRFVYYLLSRNNGYLDSLSKLMIGLKRDVSVCSSCFRYSISTGAANKCSICLDRGRDAGFLMVVSRDVDLETIEKSRSYNGYYFVLGGTVPILEKEPDKWIRAKELAAAAAKRAAAGLKEIIIATNLNPEGENTADHVAKLLSPVVKRYNIKISGLGRGLSTGTELEYIDSETMKNALKNRA